MAGDSASYVIWVWSTNAAASNVAVTGTVMPASYLGTPGFTICPWARGSTCKIASLLVGQVDELLASVPVQSSAPLATQIELTVSATASGASSYSASATDVVVAPNSAGASTIASPGAVPPLQLPPLPPLPGTGVSPINPSDLFPAVSPSPGSGSLGLPPAKSRPTVHTAEVASTVPMDARLLGAQILGLVVLAAAVTMAVVRMSLRKPQPATPRPADPADPGPTPTP